MIHLDRPEKPEELTDDLQIKLTEEFKKDSSKEVWNKSFIREALLDFSHNKCCYCEKRIGPGSADMHVDHFKPKSKYPDDVLKWNNLMPSCGDCNRNKSDHDTVEEPIVNPCEDDPKEYFYLKDCRYKSFDIDPDSKGNMTIEVLGLNDLTRKCMVRYQIVGELLDKLSRLNEFVGEWSKNFLTDTRKRNRAINTCRDLLSMCVSSSEYSAFTATALQNDQDYITVRDKLRDSGVWNDELEDLDIRSKECVFKTSRA